MRMKKSCSPPHLKYTRGSSEDFARRSHVQRTPRNFGRPSWGLRVCCSTEPPLRLIARRMWKTLTVRREKMSAKTSDEPLQHVLETQIHASRLKLFVAGLYQRCSPSTVASFTTATCNHCTVARNGLPWDTALMGEKLPNEDRLRLSMSAGYVL